MLNVMLPPSAECRWQCRRGQVGSKEPPLNLKGPAAVEISRYPALMGTLRASAPFARHPRARAEHATVERREIADPPRRDARFSQRRETSNGSASTASWGKRAF